MLLSVSGVLCGTCSDIRGYLSIWQSQRTGHLNSLDKCNASSEWMVSTCWMMPFFGQFYGQTQLQKGTSAEKYFHYFPFGALTLAPHPIWAWLCPERRCVKVVAHGVRNPQHPTSPPSTKNVNGQENSFWRAIRPTFQSEKYDTLSVNDKDVTIMVILQYYNWHNIVLVMLRCKKQHISVKMIIYINIYIYKFIFVFSPALA